MIEAAIVLPAMIFLVLTIIQLTMVQHARIMTEYAAFAAARAGIVYNADRRAMERAAGIALLPTMARSDSLNALRMAESRLVSSETTQRAAFGLPVVHVDILHPTPGHFQPNITRHLGGQEIDFDDIRPAAAAANQLQIRIRYFYRMPIPFANQMLQSIFFAARTGTLGSWRGFDMSRPEVQGGRNALADARQRGQQAASGGLGTDQGTDAQQQAMGMVQAATQGIFYFPLEGTHTMRMQSNVYLRNL